MVYNECIRSRVGYIRYYQKKVHSINYIIMIKILVGGSDDKTEKFFEQNIIEPGCLVWFKNWTKEKEIQTSLIEKKNQIC